MSSSRDASTAALPPRSALVGLPTSRRRRGELPRKARGRDTRVHNRALLLRALYEQGALARSDLVRATGLTPPTVSALIADLQADGLVADIGPRTGTRIGKPAPLMQLRDDAASIVAVDLAHDDKFRGAVLDLRANVIKRAAVPVGSDEDVAYRRVADLVRRLVDLAPSRVIGIGIGSPGIVDDRGVVRYSVNPPWTEFPLSQRIAEQFGLPTFLGNDANLAAWGVRNFRGVFARNLILVAIEHGIGAGLVVDGRLAQGEQFLAGEIGHLAVDGFTGASCTCGRVGCLDSVVSAEALRAALAAARGGRAAIVRRAGRALGKVLAPIVSALNVTQVVISGPSDVTTDDLAAAVQQSIRDRMLPSIGAHVEASVIADDGDLILQGAAALVLSEELGVLASHR